MMASEEKIKSEMQKNSERFKNEEQAAEKRGQKFIDNMIPRMEKEEGAWETAIQQQEQKNERASRDKIERQHAAEKKRLQIFEQGMKPEEDAEDREADLKWKRQNKLQEDYDDTQAEDAPDSFLEEAATDTDLAKDQP